MTTYLLLRDNKQSGPYTFDELKDKGLKAYDLVWIEGKSAAWRYPGEIDELSSFAPAVEEQPFDRFYKKPSQNLNKGSAVTTTEAATGSGQVTAATVKTFDAASNPGKRIIYVTLPAGKPALPAKEQKESSTPPSHHKYLPDHSVADISAVSPPAAEEKPSHYLQDWQTNVEISPRRNSRHSPGPGQILMIGLTVVALLAAGIFIGMSLNKDSSRLAKNLLETGDAAGERPALVEKKVVAPPVQLQPGIDAPAPGPTSASAKDSPVIVAKSASPVTHIPAPRTAAPAREKAPAPQKSLPAPGSSVKDSGFVSIPVSQRTSMHRSDPSEEKEQKEVVGTNLSNLISIGASRYKVGAFGGISDLQLTVSNRSAYALDLVVVEVQYVQANKKVFKTENLYFRGIAAGSAIMQEAPKSTRGIKVNYKITLVTSKKPGLSYSAL